jgi:hypothetical protein
MIQAHFPVTWSPQKALAVLVFALAVVGVVRNQLSVGPKAFMNEKSHDPPLCDNINDTLGISIIIFKNQHTLEKFPMR